MSSKTKIEDGGEKLWGARKDAAAPAAERDLVQDDPPLLELLWPRPERWTDLIPALGARQAALTMVAYENLAKRPHRDGWLGVEGEHWDHAYRFAIPILRDVLSMTGEPTLHVMMAEYDRRMGAFQQLVAAAPRFQYQWSYAIGTAGTRTSKHPLDFSPIDRLRAAYLAEWSWGEDPRVSDRLAFGAFDLTNRRTGKRYWKAVQGVSGGWIELDPTEFHSERAALDCARTTVAAQLATPKATRAKKPKPNWMRPRVGQEGIRAGFARGNSNGKTQNDLLEKFGFRGVEFGNWVSQSERQAFVDAAYDAFSDLTELLGMPPAFASLAGKLGLAYGSRGKGLSKIAAHFEPDLQVLHMTKDSGPGSIAHEWAHAADAWLAEHLWGKNAGAPRYASEEIGFHKLPDKEFHSEVVASLLHWARLTHHDISDLAWIETSRSMERWNGPPYWTAPCEIFARAFEVLVHDSLAAKGRHNRMLVYGVSQADGQALTATRAPFPYPMGPERAQTCVAIAALVRACLAEFRRYHEWKIQRAA